MPAGSCTYCGEPVDAQSDYRRVIAWERRREQGGTNAIRAPERLDQWACRWCVDKLAQGVDPVRQTTR